MMVEVLAVEGVTLKVLDRRALDFVRGLERVISRSAALDDTGGECSLGGEKARSAGRGMGGVMC